MISATAELLLCICLALAFGVFSVLAEVVFFLRCICFYCVRFSVFSTKSRGWLRRTSHKWPMLCRVACKTLTQSMRKCCSSYILHACIITAQSDRSPVDYRIRGDQLHWMDMFLIECSTNCSPLSAVQSSTVHDGVLHSVLRCSLPAASAVIYRCSSSDLLFGWFDGLEHATRQSSTSDTFFW